MPVVQEQSSSASPGVTPVPAPSSARVFLMIDSFETGGTERQFITLAKSLNPERFPVEIGCLQTGGPLRQFVTSARHFDLGGSLYGLRSWRTRMMLSRHLRRHRVQIAHGFDFYSNLALIPAARWAKTPVVIGSLRQLGDLLTPAQFRVQEFLFRRCDFVVCNSRAAAARLTNSGFPEAKIRVIGNALAPEFFQPASAIIPRSSGILRVGMIARMNAQYKNHDVFLRAAAKLAQSHPNSEFVLAGDGPLRQELETLCCELGIRERVYFLGDCRDVPSVLASLDVSVVPSDSESLSNAILESMAAGVPVVATQVGGNLELVGENRGLLVRCGDVDALAGALTQLFANPALRECLGSAGKDFAQTRFSTSHITAQYEALYSEILSAKLKKPATRTTVSRSCLRVAVVAPSLRYVGGQAVQADFLLRKWEGDPEIRTTFIPADPPFPSVLRWAARLPMLRTLIRAPFYWVSLWRGMRASDIVHIFSASYSSFLIATLPAWLVAKIQRKKTLINYRSGEARDHLRSSPLARAVLRRTDAIVTPNGYLVDVFAEFGLRALAIPNTVDASQFAFRQRVPLGPHLVCTRGFHPYYCIDVVVKAFAAVKKEFPAAQLDLVGGGPLEYQIRSLVAELKLPDVNFCGVATRNQIGEYYKRADIFINASRLDNMPVSVLEAFASGTPVVTTAPESMRYLVEHERTGLLSPTGDPEPLAQNVVRLLRDPALARKLIDNGLQQSRQYDWARVRQQWVQMYRELAPARLYTGSLDRAFTPDGIVD